MQVRRLDVKIIGLCGGSGSGKSEVARLLTAASFLHIDADVVYHRLTSSDTPCLRELAGTFGDEIVTPDLKLDRPKLAAIVFADGAEEKRRLLNAITHKYVLDEIRRIIREAEGSYAAAVIDAPLLFESGFNTECDLVVSVIAPRDIRVARITERDGISREQAERRIDSQLDDEFLRHHSDIIIENKGDLVWLSAEVKKITDRISEV